MTDKGFSRRDALKLGALGTAGAALLALKGTGTSHAQDPTPPMDHQGHGDHHMGLMGQVDTSAFDPMRFLTHFDYGKVSTLPSGQTLREWDVYAVDKEIEIAPGVFFPAWAYNGQVPGPTFRCNEGDRLRFKFGNGSAHGHTIHFHGVHPPSMDGSTPVVKTGETFVYEFDAKPFGLHLYHCHTMPLKRHIHKGLYGTFIIDPPGGRAPAREFVMVMNGFDTNFDGENEIYAVNSVAFHYAQNPIKVKVGEQLRVYLVNITEFDPINSFHLHAGMFRVYRTGTRLDHYDFTDTIMMCQGERHVLEFTLDHPGQYMFHAHQSELAELGWMGFFEAEA
jgi:manganese oxidase